MSTPAQRAHVKLIEQRRLPVRTVLISRSITAIDGPGGRTKAESKILHDKIQALITEGKGNLEIAAELGVTPQTIGRHRRGLVKAIT